MKVKIKIEGKINDTYTFQQPEEGNILAKAMCLKSA